MSTVFANGYPDQTLTASPILTIAKREENVDRAMYSRLASALLFTRFENTQFNSLDGYNREAHKVLLATTSTYFYNRFSFELCRNQMVTSSTLLFPG